jgi:hypothetical protein
MFTDIKRWEEEINERNQINWQENFFKLKVLKDARLLHEFTDGSKRTIRKISVDQSLMCNIPPKQVEKFWKDRWEQNPVSIQII